MPARKNAGSIEDIKSQRDRFLAFAFACADLFLEIGADGSILFALGASKSMSGLDEHEIIGKKWLNLFSVYDQAIVINFFETTKTGQRGGPIMVELNESVAKKKILLSGMKLPDRRSFYISMAYVNGASSKLASASRSTLSTARAMNRETFLEQAKDTVETARSMGQSIDMTLFDFTPTEQDRQRFGEKNWDAFSDTISAFLCSQSIDGQSAGKIADGRFSLLHEKGVDSELLKKRIESIGAEKDPTGQGVAVKTKTITSDIGSLSERDAVRALVYTINEFERQGTDLSLTTLNSGFKQFAEANAQKIMEFQTFIERLDFALYFQPIVNLQTREVSHYEMLSRFKKGDTLEWIMFGEDVGLAPEFDSAVIERALNHIQYKGGGSRTKFSVNISGQSIEDKEFFEKLMARLAKSKDAKERLLFEITESNHIRNLDKVGEFVEALQKEGYKIALDDFGAGATSFQYLQKLKVDAVKIDGKYIRKIMSSQRDAAMVKNIAQLCRDLGINVIAEYVEEQVQIDILMEFGVEYGQGYFFGKPEPAPVFTPSKK